MTLARALTSVCPIVIQFVLSGCSAPSIDTENTVLSPALQQTPAATSSSTVEHSSIASESYEERANQDSQGFEQAIKFCGQTVPLSATELRCSREAADWSKLAELAALEYLDLSGAGVTSLSFASQLPNLRALRLDGTGPIDISPLAEIPKLETLTIKNTKVSNLGALLRHPLGRSLCILKKTEDFCSPERQGRPTNDSLRSLLSSIDMISVELMIRNGIEMSDALDKGLIEKETADSIEDFPYFYLAYETQKNVEIEGLASVLKIKEGDSWFWNVSQGNPIISCYIGGELVVQIKYDGEASISLNFSAQGARQFSVWNGDANLQSPKRLLRWLSQHGIDSIPARLP